MRKPSKSYRIWHANRSGSTLLCQLLEDTGIAGKPGEHFTLHGERSLCEKFNVSDYNALIEKIWTVGSTDNGVFSDKAIGHHQAHKDTIIELSTLKGIEFPSNYQDIWNPIFPDCRHILIIRTNKVRQAVSWWKAIQDNQWHITGDQKRKHPASFYKDKYNVDALKHLFKEAVIRDIANQEYLNKMNLEYITVTYEDLVNDPLTVLQRTMNYVGLEPIDVLPKLRYQRTANELNEEWVNRFKEDLQEEWDNKVWV